MESRAKFLGHPIHQALIVFPLGLLGGAVAFDLLYLITGNTRWADVSFCLIAGGLITGPIAAVFGLIDWIAVPRNTRAKKIGMIHGLGNMLVLALFGLSFLLRYDAPFAPETSSIALGIIGFLLSGITAWLGGELVTRLGVGVYDRASLNLSSSLSKKTTHA